MKELAVLKGGRREEAFNTAALQPWAEPLFIGPTPESIRPLTLWILY